MNLCVSRNTVYKRIYCPVSPAEKEWQLIVTDSQPVSSVLIYAGRQQQLMMRIFKLCAIKSYLIQMKMCENSDLSFSEFPVKGNSPRRKVSVSQLFMQWLCLCLWASTCSFVVTSASGKFIWFVRCSFTQFYWPLCVWLWWRVPHAVRIECSEGDA